MNARAAAELSGAAVGSGVGAGTGRPEPVHSQDADFGRHHAAAARILALALTAGPGDFGAWRAAKLVWTMRLSPTERAALLCAAAWAAEPATLEALIEGRIETAGYPLPPLWSIEHAADWWAESASRWELRAYAAAAAGRLPPKDRRHLARALGSGR